MWNAAVKDRYEALSEDQKAPYIHLHKEEKEEEAKYKDECVASGIDPNKKKQMDVPGVRTRQGHPQKKNRRPEMQAHQNPRCLRADQEI